VRDWPRQSCSCKKPPAMTMQLSPCLTSFCVSSALLLACGSSGTTSTVTDAVTLIAVDPADFPKMLAISSGGTAGNAGQSADGGVAGSATSPESNLAAAGNLAQFSGGGTAGSAGRPGDGGTAGSATSVLSSNTVAGSLGQSMASGEVGGGGLIGNAARIVGDCASGVGSYVAELIDVSRLLTLDTSITLADFPVQSSLPTACNRPVAFSRVTPNRLYEVRVSTYAEDAARLCALDGTTVTTLRTGDECTAQLAQPTLSGIVCYGWQQAADHSSCDGSAGAGGTASSADAGGAAGSAGARDRVGCPGLAIEYRTITLNYCVKNDG
jgi:hypothetical protein